MKSIQQLTVIGLPSLLSETRAQITALAGKVTFISERPTTDRVANLRIHFAKRRTAREKFTGLFRELGSYEKIFHHSRI